MSFDLDAELILPSPGSGDWRIGSEQTSCIGSIGQIPTSADRASGMSDFTADGAGRQLALDGSGVVDSEQKLIRCMNAVRERDPSALTALHRSCAPKAHAVAMRIVRDSYLADEVVADCFWQIWRDADRFDVQRGSVAAWICAIARSRALDALRRRQTWSRHEAPLEESLDDVNTESASDFDLAADGQRNSTLRRLLIRIDPTQRQMLFLAFVWGLSHQEIAGHCGIALGTVKSHIRRGLATLRGDCTAAGLDA